MLCILAHVTKFRHSVWKQINHWEPRKLFSSILLCCQLTDCILTLINKWQQTFQKFREKAACLKFRFDTRPKRVEAARKWCSTTYFAQHIFQQREGRNLITSFLSNEGYSTFTLVKDFFLLKKHILYWGLQLLLPKKSDGSSAVNFPCCSAALLWMKLLFSPGTLSRVKTTTTVTILSLDS